MLTLTYVLFAHFTSEEGRETALEGLRVPHDQQQFHTILLAPHQGGSKQIHRCGHSI